MRRSDKLKNIVRANMLAEQRYLESKGVLTEGIYSFQDFINLVYNQEKDLSEKFFVALRNGTIKLPSNNEPFIDKAYLKQLNIYDDTEIDKIINLLSAKKVAPDMNTVDGRIQGLNDFFKSAGNEGDYVEMRDIYKHFKNNGEINNLPSNLRLIYDRAYKLFTKEEFMKIFLSLDKTKGTDRIIAINMFGDEETINENISDDPHWRDEDLMPGGKEWKLDRGLDEDSLSEGRTTRADIVVFSHLSDIPLDKANVRKRAEFIKFIIDKCDGDLNKDIDPEALWSEFSEEFTEGVLNEGSDTYFETLSAALDHVRRMAEKMGYELDEDAVHFQFGTGGISYGQTKSATIPLLKDGEPIMGKSGKPLNRAISVSIYRMDSGRYELTAYKTF